MEFLDHAEIKELDVGCIINVVYAGIQKSGKLIFELKHEPCVFVKKEIKSTKPLQTQSIATFKFASLENEDWYAPELDDMLGTIVSVIVTVNHNQENEYWVKARYKGNLPLTSYYYPTNLKEIKKACNKLSNGDIIQCLIVSINKGCKDITLKWVTEIVK